MNYRKSNNSNISNTIDSQSYAKKFDKIATLSFWLLCIMLLVVIILSVIFYVYEINETTSVVTELIVISIIIIAGAFLYGALLANFYLSFKKWKKSLPSRLALRALKFYRDISLFLNKLRKNQNKDKRGHHNKAKYIVPQDNLWHEARDLYNKHRDRCISRNDSKNPSTWLLKNLSGETSDKSFFGFAKDDIEKNNPLQLKYAKIRDLLIANPEKWRN